MRVVSCLLYEHNLYLVLLAALVCILGSIATIRLFRQALDASLLPRIGWIFLTGVCAGSSIWSTHFIAILGYQPPAPVTFDPTLTILSIVIAVLGSAAGFAVAAFTSRRPWLIVGGAVAGLAIAAMHYTGMFAYRVDGTVSWRSGYLLASILLASGVTAGSVWAAGLWRSGPTAHAAVPLLVGAIVILHFTGMAAFEVTPMPGAGAGADGEAFRAMALSVALVGFIIVGTGITSQLLEVRTRAESEQQLRYMALHDPLTGLPNRNNFSIQLARMLSEAATEGAQLAVIGIDLDRFKELNDTWGHRAGDEALQDIGNRMAEAAVEGLFFARVGGDEFYVAATVSQKSDLTRIARRVEALVLGSAGGEDRRSTLGASIGIAVFPRDGQDVDALTRNADLAMYRAKVSTEEKICFYDGEIGALVRERRQLANELRDAIARDELSLHYQVQTSIEDDRIIGYEALLRWRHPERGNVPPAQFIPLAEEDGLMLALGEWVLRRACHDAASWQPAYPVAVNLSALQLADAALPQLVHEILIESSLQPSRLELELTETALIRDKVRSLHVMRQIKALGVSIALDDFGTGYSSLSTLRAFPFDKIKLDRSFIEEVCVDAQALAIVRAVTSLGKSLMITVLAEGIETAEQLDLLRREACDGAQGYLMGRPMAVDQLAAYGGPIQISSLDKERSASHRPRTAASG